MGTSLKDCFDISFVEHAANFECMVYTSLEVRLRSVLVVDSQCEEISMCYFQS